jgi:hypothetical protein
MTYFPLRATMYFAAGLLTAGTADAQQADTQAGTPPARAAKSQAAVKGPRPAPKTDPFAVTNWFEIPSGNNIAPESSIRKKVDLAVREDPNNITVNEKKQKFEPRNWSRQDLDEPWLAAPSVDMPVQQNSSCEGAAYDTVGGQPGTGRDMIGALGAGSGC